MWEGTFERIWYNHVQVIKIELFYFLNARGFTIGDNVGSLGIKFKNTYDK